MTLKKKLFENFNLYAVTNIEKATSDVINQIDKAYRGGAGLVQLRSTQITDREFIRLGLKIRQISRHFGKAFAINNRVDIALAVDADVIHVGQNDLPIETLREILQKFDSEMAIGKSTHSLTQALEAEEEGVDYIGVGPIFTTPTKPDYIPVGLELIEQVKRKIRIPFVAIGGIDETNIKQVLDAGAPAAAVVRAIFSAADPQLAAKNLKSFFDQKRMEHV